VISFNFILGYNFIALVYKYIYSLILLSKIIYNYKEEF
jgi:hypothetical protein